MTKASKRATNKPDNGLLFNRGKAKDAASRKGRTKAGTKLVPRDRDPNHLEPRFTLRCAGCLAPRPPKSFPLCKDCRRS